MWITANTDSKCPVYRRTKLSTEEVRAAKRLAQLDAKLEAGISLTPVEETEFDALLKR